MRYPGGAALVCLLAAGLCGSPVTVFPYPMSVAGGLLDIVVLLTDTHTYCLLNERLPYSTATQFNNSS